MQVFLYISTGKKVVGCAIVEAIEHGYPVVNYPPSQNSSQEVVPEQTTTFETPATEPQPESHNEEITQPASQQENPPVSQPDKSNTEQPDTKEQ